MIIEMLPEQVANSWRILERVIKEALPPIADSGERKMNNILTSILTRKMICWVSYQDQNDVEIDTVILTTVVMDEISGTKSLLIYAINSLKLVTSDIYEDMIKKITKYARSMKCDKIVGYLSDPKLHKFVESQGGDCSYHLMTFDLEE
jgi:hypothetical protein